MLLLLLLLLEVIVPVTSPDASAQMVSFGKLRTEKNGPVRCALDQASRTTASSFEDCSLKCTLDATCTGFNLKGTQNCDVYN